MIEMSENQIVDNMLDKKYLSELVLNYKWVNRAVNSGMRTEDNESVRTAVEKHPKLGWMVFPTIRKEGDSLKKYGVWDAMDLAIENGDYIPVNSVKSGQALSHGLSNYLGSLK